MKNNAHLPAQKQPLGAIPCRVTAEKPCAAKSRVSEAGQGAKPGFCIGVKDSALPQSPPERARRDAGMDVLCEMLFSPSGELYNHLYDSGMISPGLTSEYVSTRDFAFLLLGGEADDPEAVFAEMQKYIEEKQKNGLDRQDFERCRRIEYAEYIKGFDSTEEIANTLLSFVSEKMDYFGYADVIRDLTFDDVEGLLRQIFRPEAFTLSVITPRAEQSKEVSHE